MATEFNRAVARFIATCAYVTAVHDLVTKWRLELVGGYILDLYFNETLGKYGYTLVQAHTRVMGWDNAPHHPGLANFPHHVHRPDGQIERIFSISRGMWDKLPICPTCLPQSIERIRLNPQR